MLDQIVYNRLFEYLWSVYTTAEYAPGCAPDENSALSGAILLCPGHHRLCSGHIRVHPGGKIIRLWFFEMSQKLEPDGAE